MATADEERTTEQTAQRSKGSRPPASRVTATTQVARVSPPPNAVEPRALSHEVRALILDALGGSTMSAVQLADELGRPLGTVAYHVRVLLDASVVQHQGPSAGARSTSEENALAAAALGHVVRETRQAHGWTQEDLGARAGFHWSYVSSIERGRRNVGLATLLRLATALEIPAADLAGRAERALRTSKEPRDE